MCRNEASLARRDYGSRVNYSALASACNFAVWPHRLRRENAWPFRTTPTITARPWTGSPSSTNTATSMSPFAALAPYPVCDPASCGETPTPTNSDPSRSVRSAYATGSWSRRCASTLAPTASLGECSANGRKFSSEARPKTVDISRRPRRTATRRRLPTASSYSCSVKDYSSSGGQEP